MYDLSMRLKSSKEKDSRLAVKRLFELGWDCVAWTTSVNGKVTSNQIKPMKSVALEPMQRRNALELRSLATKRSEMKDLRQMSRINVTIDDVIDAQSLTSGNTILNSFDIIAVRPGNLKVMAYLCKTAEIDIITLDFTHRLPFSTNKKLLDEAVKRGIHFEIIYSPILGAASGPRAETFSNTRVLIQYLRGRNVIISSGADNIANIRGPMDVCNIGERSSYVNFSSRFIRNIFSPTCKPHDQQRSKTSEFIMIGRALGLSNEQALNSVSDNCAMVLKHAIARKCRFLPLEVITRSEFQLRFPEINLSESQGSLKYSGSQSNLGGSLPFGFEDDDAEEEEEDDDDDYPRKNMKKIAVTSAENNENSMEEDFIKMDDSILMPTNQSGTASSSPPESSDPSPADMTDNIGDVSDRDVDVDERIERSEGIDDDLDDHDSFGLGDAFISFSDAPPSTSTSSNKRSHEEEEEEVGEVVRQESKIVKTETIPKTTTPSASKFIRAKKLKKLKPNKNNIKSLRNK